MSKSTTIIRQRVFSRPQRHFSTSSARRTSTSPQRRNLPAAAARVKPKKFTDIPGPLTLPMLRHHDHILPRIGCYHHTVGLGLLDGMRSRYGDLVRLAKAGRSRPVLYVFDPDLMMEVYESKATESPRWLQSPLDVQRIRTGGCPVRSDESNAIWSALQMLLRDACLRENYNKGFDEIARDFTRRLADLRHAENALNDELCTETYRWALEIMGMLVFGIRLGCLDGAVHVPTAENRTPEKTCLDDHTPDLCSLSKRSLNDLTPAEKFIRCSLDIVGENYLLRNENTIRKDSQNFLKALKAFDTHYSLIEHYLQQATGELNKGQLKPEQALFEKIQPLNDRLLPLASDIFLAGIDPLAHTALTIFYHLSLHAALQQRAHDEVLWARASKEEGADAPDMLYINTCIREVMRLHPITGGVVRRSRYDLIIGGYEIPSGVNIVLAHGVSSNAKDQWRRPKSFIPERWCPQGWEPLRASGAHPIASLPFGQACPATHIVTNMLSSLTTRVLDSYRLEWHGPAPNIMTTGVNKLQKPYFFVLQNAA